MTHSVAVEDRTRKETVGEAVVSTVAAATDTAPLSLEPLYDAIDSNVAAALFERDRDGADGSQERVEFTYAGCNVVVGADGTVSASNTDGTAETTESWP
ncbi:HalOD1 output domain-containing protein [Halosimplex sp. J119]